jgi:AraC-like DNA-binding protein
MNEHQEHITYRQLTTFDNLELLRATYITQTFSRHFHDEFCIGVIEQGVHLTEIRRQTWVVTAGRIIVSNPGEMHTGRPGDQNGWSYRMLYPSAALLQQTVSFVDEHYHGLPVFPQPVIRDRELAGNILRLHHLLETQADTLAQESLFVWTIGRLLQRYTISQPTVQRLRPEHAAVRRVQTYLADHYAEHVSLDQLAQLTQLSPFHLLRVFQAQVGMPPHQYLMQLRVTRAKSLLAAQIPPAAVAHEMGFVDQTHFSRQFKRIVGVPPGQFARNRNFILDSSVNNH